VATHTASHAPTPSIALENMPNARGRVGRYCTTAFYTGMKDRARSVYSGRNAMESETNRLLAMRA
jgi:hypothetical protein